VLLKGRDRGGAGSSLRGCEKREKAGNGQRNKKNANLGEKTVITGQTKGHRGPPTLMHETSIRGRGGTRDDSRKRQ